MAQFSVNAQRFDPYRNFNFRVRWDGRYVAGVSKLSALKRTTKVVEHREGGDSSAFRKDIIIEVYNEAGQLALAYKVYRCWVSELQALPDLDANANAVAIQTTKLEDERGERDYDVPKPVEPRYTKP